jgi:hypothetical protein
MKLVFLKDRDYVFTQYARRLKREELFAATLLIEILQKKEVRPNVATAETLEA